MFVASLRVCSQRPSSLRRAGKRAFGLNGVCDLSSLQTQQGNNGAVKKLAKQKVNSNLRDYVFPAGVKQLKESSKLKREIQPHKSYGFAADRALTRR